jgi:hypothetical protein
MPERLTSRERATLLQFGVEGPGGNFDQASLTKLFSFGLIEVRSKDRWIVLTQAGREACRKLRAGQYEIWCGAGADN